MDACELRCYNEPNCVSINFNYTANVQGTYRCDLNNATHVGHDKEFVHRDGYLYRGADVSSSSSLFFFPAYYFLGFRTLSLGSGQNYYTRTIPTKLQNGWRYY